MAVEKKGSRSNHDKLIASINSLASNIKAEVIIADLFRECNFHPEQISVRNMGGHKKGFASDIEKSKFKSSFGGGTGLEFNLNRDSIYDTLPESIFHPPVKHEFGRGQAAIMIAEYKKHKKEEKQARKFFAPIENEIFYHRLGVEQMEIDQLFKISNRDLPLPFFDLRNVDSRLPQKLYRKWLSLLPYLHELVGDIEKIANCLAFLLNKKVRIEELSPTENVFHEKTAPIGECLLGENMLLGNKLNAFFDNYCLVIENLQAKEASRFVKGFEYYKFMKSFIDTFIPLNIDVSWRVEINKDEKWELSKSKKHTSRLNFTTVI